MSIVSIKRMWVDNPNIVVIIASSPDTLTTVSANGYITSQAANIFAANSGAFTWKATDEVLVNIGGTQDNSGNYVGGTNAIFQISADFTSLTPLAFSTTVIGTPVVVGDFATFASTSGNLQDQGYKPTNAALTAVVMQSGAAVIGHIAAYNDTTGTLVDSGVSDVGLASLNTSRSVSVTMTNTQVNGAFAAPVQLIPAPGAGFAIMVTAMQLVTQVSTAFAAGGVGNVQYAATVNGAGKLAVDATTPAADITAATSQIYTQYGLATTTVTTGITNQGIFFSNKTAAFTGGAGSTVTAVLNYMIVPATV